MHKILLICSLFIVINAVSQTENKEKVSKFLENNALFEKNKEESFFLHTNKSVYFSGEKIWFAGYVYDESQEKPSLITTNLHINLYDTDFKLIDTKLYYVKNGTSHGQFSLSEALPSGIYYLESETNWNKNFKKERVTEIEIINLDLKSEENFNSSSSVAEKESKKEKQTIPNDFLIQRSLKTINSAVFKIKTTNTLVKKHKNTTLYAVLHKNGNLRSCAPIPISDKINYALKFDSKLFFKGTNTITLFDINNKILGESDFWNLEKDIQNIKVEKQVIKEDTLSITLKFLDKIKDPSISISILNEETELVPNQQNIIGTFLGSESLIDSHQKQTYLEPNKPVQHKNEKGVRLRGKVNTRKRNIEGFMVALASQENEIFLVKPLESDRSFEFKDLFLKHPTKYKLTLLNKRGKIVAAKFYIFDDAYAYKPKYFLTRTKKDIASTFKENTISKKNVFFKKEAGYVQLDEIVIKSVVDKEVEIRKKYKNIIGFGFTDFYIPDDYLALGTDIFYYLGNLPGLRLSYPPLTATPLLFNTRGNKSITGGSTVNVKLNGVWLGDDLLPLTGLLTTDFEVIMVNLSGAGEGLRGSNGVVNLIIRTDVEYIRENNKNKIVENETLRGFEIALKTYKKPMINFNDTSLEKAFATIDWISNLKIDANKRGVIKVPVSNIHKHLKLIINGFDKNGILIHEKFIIAVQ